MSRTKTMAQSLVAEIDLHNEVLDEVADRMETVNEQLLQNTERTRQIDFRSDTCGLWFIAFVLFVAIIIVAVI